MDPLLALLREHSYKQGSFVLASGRTSDFFIDCKSTVLRAAGHLHVGEALGSVVRQIEAETEHPIEAVAGVAVGGCPLASAVALVSMTQAAQTSGQAPFDAVYVRKSTKDHGTSRQIEGAEHLQPGAKLVLLEDTVTTGGSSVRAAKILEGAGFNVVSVVAIVDREEGAAQAFQDAGLAFRALYTRRDFQ